MSIPLLKIYTFSATGTIGYSYGKKWIYPVSHTIQSKVSVDSRPKCESKRLRFLEEKKEKVFIIS